MKRRAFLAILGGIASMARVAKRGGKKQVSDTLMEKIPPNSESYASSPKIRLINHADMERYEHSLHFQAKVDFDPWTFAETHYIDFGPPPNRRWRN